MRELAVQSSNGSNSADNRAAIQAEVLQLKNEINNIATKTSHNDIKLLNGSAGDIVLQTGVNTGDTMTLKFESAQAKDLGIGTPLALTSLAKSTSALARGDILINGVQVDASIAQDDALSFASNSGSAIAKAAAINKVSDLTGVVATVGKTVVYGSSQTANASSAVATGTISINGVATSTLAFAVSESTDLARSKTIDAINAISAQTGVKALDGGDAAHGVVLVAEDGRNITVSYSASGIMGVAGVRTETTTTVGTTAASYVGTYSLTSVDGSDISLSSRVGGTIANADFYTGTYKANVAQFVSGARAASTAAPTALE
jgi:flagellin